MAKSQKRLSNRTNNRNQAAVAWLRHKAAIWAIAAAVVLIAGGFYIWQSQRSIIDRSVVSQANFPVYLPESLPNDYQVDNQATEVNDNVLIYKINNPKTGSHITTTVQPWPTGFTMSKMVEGGSVRSTAMQVGTLYDLSTANSTKYLLDAGSTLIFITSPNKIDAAIIHSLVDSLKKSD